MAFILQPRTHGSKHLSQRFVRRPLPHGKERTARMCTTRPVQTHKVLTHAVQSRLSYIRRFKGKNTLTREKRVAERLVLSSTPASSTPKQPTASPTASMCSSQPWKTSESKLVSTRPQQLKPLKPLSNRHPQRRRRQLRQTQYAAGQESQGQGAQGQGEATETREGHGTPEHKARAQGRGLMVCTATPIYATKPPTTCDIACDGVSATGRLSARARKTLLLIRGGSLHRPPKSTAHPQDLIKECRYWTPLLSNYTSYTTN
jgi:hypothetical protein